jgi:hypothetical protein
MSTSTTLPPLAGQNHDREEDALMQDSANLANGYIEATTHISNGDQPPAPGVAVEVAAVDEDAMDTSPDNNQGLVLPNGSADAQEALGITPSSPAPTGEVQTELDSNAVPPPPSTDNTVSRTSMTIADVY